MILNMYDILEEFQKTPSKETLLKYQNYKPFIELLRYTYDPRIKFYIKEFPKNYKKPDTVPGIRYNGINNILSKLYLFIIGNPTADKLNNLPQKQNKILLEILESLEPKEAQTLINVFNKNLKTPKLNYKLVKETFPTLLP